MNSWFGWATSDPNRKICLKKPKGKDGKLTFAQQMAGCSGCDVPGQLTNSTNVNGCTWVPMQYAKQ